jgi:hypothetical protein
MASVTDSSALPDYAPVPPSALGPAVNEQGYYVDLGVGSQVHP